MTVQDTYRSFHEGKTENCVCSSVWSVWCENDNVTIDRYSSNSVKLAEYVRILYRQVD